MPSRCTAGTTQARGEDSEGSSNVNAGDAETGQECTSGCVFVHAQSSIACSQLPPTQQSLRTERLTTARRAELPPGLGHSLRCGLTRRQHHYPTHPVNTVMQNARYPHRHALRSSLGTRGGHRLRLAAVPTTLGGVMISDEDHQSFSSLFDFGFCALLLSFHRAQPRGAHGLRDDGAGPPAGEEHVRERG